MKKDSTSGLSPKRLASLLGIALDNDSGGDKNNPEHNTAELLNARLNGMLPLDTTVVEELPVILGRLYKDIMPSAGKTLGQVLTDSKSNLDTIKKIREYAKKMTSRKVLSGEKAVAVAIYYAAIANALLFHDIKITTYSYKSLDDSFIRLINKPWISTELAKLFIDASKICRKKEK